VSAIHVIPINDLKEHTESDQCECQPHVIYVGNGGKVVVHNTYDKREFFEEWELGKEVNVQ